MMMVYDDLMVGEMMVNLMVHNDQWLVLVDELIAKDMFTGLLWMMLACPG